MKGNEMNDIPSDEDFARADRLMAERDRNLNIVSKNVKSRFSGLCPLFNFFVIWQLDVDFRAYVFFNEDKDIEICKKNGTVEALKGFVYDELERVGRGKRDEIAVEFEFDSHENVVANYEGDYYLRLR